MAEAIAGASAIAVASSQATSIASAVAQSIAQAVAGISIGVGYAGGQVLKESTGTIRDYAKNITNTVFKVLREYYRLLTEKPEVGLTGTLLAIYLLA